LLKFQSAWNVTKMVPLRPSRLPDSSGIFTLSNGLRMEKISQSVRQAKQAKNLMLTVPVRIVRTDADVAGPYVASPYDTDVSSPYNDTWQVRTVTCGTSR
jgi:hypothetical protein